MQASDDTVALIRQELAETDGMCRYHGYLAQRLARQAELLQMGSVAAPLATIFTLLSGFPAWVPAAAAAATALFALAGAAGRYPHRAAQSAEIWRRLGRQHLEWEQLWNGIRAKDDAEALAAWKALRARRDAIVEGARGELPRWRALARRSRREADEHRRHAGAATARLKPRARS